MREKNELIKANKKGIGELLGEVKVVLTDEQFDKLCEYIELDVDDAAYDALYDFLYEHGF